MLAHRSVQQSWIKFLFEIFYYLKTTREFMHVTDSFRQNVVHVNQCPELKSYRGIFLSVTNSSFCLKFSGIRRNVWNSCQHLKSKRISNTVLTQVWHSCQTFLAGNVCVMFVNPVHLTQHMLWICVYIIACAWDHDYRHSFGCMHSLLLIGRWFLTSSLAGQR